MMCKEHAANDWTVQLDDCCLLSVYTPPVPNSSNNFKFNSSKYLDIYFPASLTFNINIRNQYTSYASVSGKNPQSQKNKSQRWKEIKFEGRLESLGHFI